MAVSLELTAYYKTRNTGAQNYGTQNTAGTPEHWQNTGTLAEHWKTGRTIRKPRNSVTREEQRNDKTKKKTPPRNTTNTGQQHIEQMT